MHEQYEDNDNLSGEPSSKKLKVFKVASPYDINHVFFYYLRGIIVFENQD